MRLMSRRSCFRTLLLLLATSSFITFTFLLRCHGGSRPEDDVKAELLIAARGNVGDVGNTIIDINSLDSRPEDISSRRHIAEHRQDAQFQQQPQQKQQQPPQKQQQPPQKQQQPQSHQKQQQSLLPQQKQQPPQSLQQFQEQPPQEQRRQETYIKYNEPQLPLHQYKEIDCVVNSDYTVQARLENGEVYLPFSFIHKYFEVQGQVVQYNGAERFEWQHSNARIYVQDPYKVDGIFMSFHHYNVESRDRVKYFSGVEGVPLSTQWGQQGYFYPIQVAQFGLSHYSKNLTERPPRVTMYEDVEGHDLSSWSNPSPNGEIKIVTSEELNSHVLEFKTTGDTSPSSSSVWSHSLDTKSDFVIAFDLKLLGNASITIVAESEEQGRIISLVYTTDDDGFVIGNRKVTYGLGPVTQWRRITRALQIDYRKAMASLSTIKYKLTRKFILQRLLRIELRGHGFIDNIEIATSLHMYHFYDAADWLVHHQDERGGWPIMVERILDDKMSLSPGWYSSMAQGQAMSVLTRAYIKSRRKKYIKAALHAARLFQIPSAQGGVLAKFMDKYTWYEEYPTSPGSFVLNGFIYSMIGLYDVLSVADVEESRESRRLYDEGMVSLKAMLLLFDMGTGTLYDLRHLALGKAPNVARWDYHATHISQLQLLASIDPDPIFKETVARWIGYTKGKRARHN